jgi:signal transduction histidine kinase
VANAAGAEGSDPSRRLVASQQVGVFLNAILTNSKLPVMATDVNGVIQLFSVGAERMLGYSAVEVVGRITADEIHDPRELMVRARAVTRELSTKIAADFAALACKASFGVEDCYESILICKNRERIRVAMTITALRDDRGSMLGYSLLVTDMAVGRHLAFEPYDAPSAPRQAQYSQSDLLTRMSHEMRTPLSAILGFAQLMESSRHSQSDSHRKSIARILQAGWYLEKLIGMTRDLALIESGTLSLSLESVPLAAVMRECQAMIEPQAQLCGVRVSFPLLESRCSVSADRIRLQDALGHLLSAAIEYSEAPGEIVVECETHGTDWVRINLRGGGADSCVERLQRSFRPFDDLEREADPADGPGIGVLLAKRLVELMGGAIGGKSDHGTRKVLSFDLKRTSVPMSAGRVATHPDSGAANGTGGGRPQSTVHSPEKHVHQRG